MRSNVDRAQVDQLLALCQQHPFASHLTSSTQSPTYPPCSLPRLPSAVSTTSLLSQPLPLRLLSSCYLDFTCKHSNHIHWTQTWHSSKWDFHHHCKCFHNTQRYTVWQRRPLLLWSTSLWSPTYAIHTEIQKNRNRYTHNACIFTVFSGLSKYKSWPVFHHCTHVTCLDIGISTTIPTHDR